MSRHIVTAQCMLAIIIHINIKRCELCFHCFIGLFPDLELGGSDLGFDLHYNTILNILVFSRIFPFLYKIVFSSSHYNTIGKMLLYYHPWNLSFTATIFVK